MNTRRAAIVGCTVATAAALGGLGYAAIPSSTGLISACYDNVTGQVRVFDPAGGPIRNCQTHETDITWNAQGPQGPQGVRGLQGAAGRNGVAGPTSLAVGANGVGNSNSEVTIVSRTITSAEAGLTLIWATGIAERAFQSYDGPDVLLGCTLRRPGNARSRAVFVQSHGSEWWTFLGRGLVAAGDVVRVGCRKIDGPGEVHVEAQLMLAKVGS